MSEALIISDINGICRLCLKDNGTIIPIFGRENTSRDCIPLSKKILDCVSVNVVHGDGLPNTICVSCVHQVDSWHGFKNTCDSSQKKLSSWLKKTNPDLFKKNEAEKRWRNRRNSSGPNAQSSSVIDVSSDDDNDDEVVITQPVMRHVFSGRRQQPRSRLTGHHQNFQLMSINTNEIEILPIDNVSCISGKGGDLDGGVHNPISDLPDVVTGLNTSVTLVQSRSTGQLLPDSDLSEHPHVESLTKDVIPKGVVINEQVAVEEAPEENLEEDESNRNIEQVQIIETEFHSVADNDGSESNDHVALTENAVDSPVNSHPLVEQENSEWSNVNCAEEISGKENETENRIDDESTNCAPSGNSVDNNINGEKTLDFDKPIEDSSMNSTENSSSFVIEKITSLTNHERMDEDLNSQQQDDENADVLTTSSRLTQDEDSQDAQPDIVLCDPSMVMNIKEEPLSASEATGDEEDPLNFHNITLKGESMEWPSETEDVKPNIRLLNEAMETNYTPKRLKCGKLHCEPCRVSFINDVYYERHATSLRHKLNFKLFRSGRAPTRKRGKSLIQAIMGNNFETVPKTGPFFCNQCPSAFKHLRNLKTHQKKHLVQAQYTDQYQPSPSGSQEIFDMEPSMQETEQPSKPPMRLSAQNARFVNQAETMCDLCDQSFTTLPALLSHKRYCGFSENRVCKWCRQTFTTLSLFFKHRKECTKLHRAMSFDTSQQQVNNYPPAVPSPVPKDGSVLACTLCNLSFETSADLIDHMQKNHMDFGKPQPHMTELPNFAKPNHFSRTNDSRLHYCKYCLRSFTTHSALSSHTGYHARKSVYCCKFCRHSYRDKLTFRQHMKTHISNPNLNRNVCWICYTPFSSHKDLIDHKNVHAKIKMKIFSCDSCDNSYNTRELLAKHKRTAHDAVSQMTMFGDHILEDDGAAEPKVQMMDEDNKLFKCRICKKRFTTLGNLKRHNLIHKRPQNVGNFGVVNSEHTYQNRCNWCLRTFKTQSGLLNHKPLCNRVKTTAVPNANALTIGNPFNKALKCKGCKKWFASKNSLYKHKVLKRCRVMPVNPIVQLRPKNCPNCDQQFLSEESLNRHKQLCKPTIERLTCDCGEVFASVEQKLIHADSCQSNCTCKFCNMKFNSPDELESHKSICQIQSQRAPSPQPSYTNETRATPLECHKCNKKFIYNKCLRMHLDKCLYDRWPCTNCMEIFASETALATHKSHKTCQSSRLNNKSSLLVPPNESPTFKCEYCPTRFTSGSELKQHSFTCENRPSVRQKDVDLVYRPWSCDLCDKSFLWKANLWRHKKLIHKIVVQSKRSVTGSSSTSGSPSRTGQDGEKELYKCTYCPDIIFHKKQGFIEHQMAHEREKGKHNLEPEVDDGENVLLTCELCDKKIPESFYPLHMDEHMNDDFEGSPEQEKDDSTTGEKYACDICGKEFATSVSRKSHRATHYRSGDIMAHEMSPKKKDKRKIKVKHVRCHTCHKLLSINSMHKHRMMHAREEAEFFGENQNSTPIKSSSVANTPRSATPSVMSDVQSEINEDDDTTVFPCPKCDGSFKLRKSLLEHMKGHADDSMETESTSSATGPADQYQYKCVYCDLSWKYKSVYERHLASKKHLEIQKQLAGII